MGEGNGQVDILEGSFLLYWGHQNRGNEIRPRLMDRRDIRVQVPQALGMVRGREESG